MFRIASRGLGLVVVVIVTYAIAGTVGALWNGPVASVSQGGEVRVGLIRGPIHYDFLLPTTEGTRHALGFAETGGVPMHHPDVAYILAGWGSRKFYTATGTYRDLDPGIVWDAATGDQSVLRIDVVGAFDESDTSWVTLSKAGYAALLAFIADTQSGGVVAGGFTETDAFFEAHGAFDIFRTCNTWIGRGLRNAGHPFGRWTPTPHAVRISLWWNLKPRPLHVNASIGTNL